MAIDVVTAYGPPTLLDTERMAWKDREGRLQDRRRAQTIARDLRMGAGEGPAWMRGRLKRAVNPRRVIDFLRGELAVIPGDTTREQRVEEYDMAKKNEQVAADEEGAPAETDTDGRQPFTLRISGEWGYFELEATSGPGCRVSAELPTDVADRLVAEIMREYYPLGE